MSTVNFCDYKKLLYMKQRIIVEKIFKVSGQQSIRRYECMQVLGQGGFAICYKVRQLQSNKIFACKTVLKKNLHGKLKPRLLSQIKIHKTLKHQHILYLFHVFQDSQHVYILFQLCQMGTLKSLIKSRGILTVPQISYFTSQLIQGLAYLHKLQIIHRDLKSSNILLDSNMKIKIADFGLCTKLQFEDEKKRTICGTPNYIAPQIISEVREHSYSADIWSLGVVLYTMSVGKPPFQTLTVADTYKKIIQGDFTFPTNSSVHFLVKQLICSTLVLDPQKRLNIQQLQQHPFFLKIRIPKSIPKSAFIEPPQLSQDNYVQKVFAKTQHCLISKVTSQKLLQIGQQSTVTPLHDRTVKRQYSCKNIKLRSQSQIPMESQEQKSSRVYLIDYKQQEKAYFYATSSGQFGILDKNCRLHLSNSFVFLGHDKPKSMSVKQVPLQYTAQLTSLQKYSQQFKFKPFKLCTLQVRLIKIYKSKLGLLGKLSNGSFQLLSQPMTVLNKQSEWLQPGGTWRSLDNTPTNQTVKKMLAVIKDIKQ